MILRRKVRTVLILFGFLVVLINIYQNMLFLHVMDYKRKNDTFFRGQPESLEVSFNSDKFRDLSHYENSLIDLNAILTSNKTKKSAEKEFQEIPNRNMLPQNTENQVERQRTDTYLRIPKTPKSVTLLNDLIKNKKNLTNLEILEAKKLINALNNEQFVYNKDKFPKPFGNEDIVIAIQVHDRVEHLQSLVQSLREAVSKFNETRPLLVFSHDHLDYEMNRFVQSIPDFRLVQIFFPFSIQLHPNTFPGNDPRDCPSKPTKGTNTSNCLNREWPDSYGNYRSYALSQIKHHWTWKINKIFNMKLLKDDFNGSVVFLEEDHYVLPDFFYVFEKLKRVNSEEANPYNVLALGNHNKFLSYSGSKVGRGEWLPNYYNLGFVLNKKSFEVLQKCQKIFCNFDEYNWDWTITHATKKCAKEQFNAFVLKLSRVLHIGSCGTHVHKTSCDLKSEVEKSKSEILKQQNQLFPKELQVDKTFKVIRIKNTNGFGGWGDLRDNQLCLSMISDRNTSADLVRIRKFEKVVDITKVLL